MAQFEQAVPRKAIFPGLAALGPEERALADTLLRQALDQEGLYSLMADLKPMSTVQHLRYPLAKDSTMRDGDREVADPQAQALAQLARYQKVLRALSFGNLQFVMLPFKAVHKPQERNLQILVCRRDLIDRTIARYQSFFGQWGFTPGVSPEVLLTTIEFETKHDRFRAYGYLFGYPEYAVDFFVSASLAEEKTKEFVKRDFFDIPVYVGRKGHFTYALPQGQPPSPADSTIRQSAAQTLQTYRLWRAAYTSASGLAASTLLADYFAAKPQQRGKPRK